MSNEFDYIPDYYRQLRATFDGNCFTVRVDDDGAGHEAWSVNLQHGHFKEYPFLRVIGGGDSKEMAITAFNHSFEGALRYIDEQFSE